MPAFTKLTLLTFLLLCAPALRAADYVVELIVFEAGEAAAGGDVVQTFTEPRHLPAERLARPLSDFKRLTRDEMALQVAWERLINSRLYQPLMHVGWAQEGVSGEEAFTVDLGARARADVSFGGTARLERERFLHLTLDFEFEADGQSFRLHERRRMRSREMHYFDHPRFGVIAIVAPAS